MKSFLARFLKKQKLLLGILWLMLRGNSVDGQHLYSPHTYCYVTPHKDALFSHLDLSGGASLSDNKSASFLSDISFGRNYGSFTTGLNMNYLFDKTILFAGPYLRVFSSNISRDSMPSKISHKQFNFFLEGKYGFDINNSFDNSGFTFSGGVIFFTKLSTNRVGHFGFEVFESFSNTACDRRNYFFSTGIRFHYYINE